MKSLLLRQIIVMSKSTFYGFILQSIFYGAILAGDLNAQNSEKSILEIYITINVENVSIKRVFDQIELETGFSFAYNSQKVNLNRQVSLNYQNSDLASVLVKISKDANLKFKRINGTIHVGKRKKSEPVTVEEQIREQKITIIGRVTSSDDDSGLPGVNILIKGTSQGTVTDIDGSYKLDVPDENAVLVFSSVGFIKEEITVGNQTVINVVISPDLTALKEIVITSFGIKREKKSLTYSTQTVDTEELTEARELNILNTLEGKVAGLAINSSGEGIGASSRVILRGNRSLSGDSQPLYVVDGVPIRGGIDYISPDNISAISVLKGPNAAALYGSDAQNGAIVIETKKGSGDDDMLVSLNNTFMTLNPVLNIPFQNVYGQGLGGVYGKSSEFAWGPKMNGQMVETWSLDPEDAGKQYAFSPQPNNRTDLFQNGYNFSSNLFIGMNKENTQTAFSYTYTDGEGLLPGNKLQRHNIFLRINNKIFNRLSLDTKIAYINNTVNNAFNQGNDSFNPVRQVYLMPANIRTEDVRKFEYKTLSGNMMQNFWYRGSTMGANPYWALHRVPDVRTNQDVLVTSSLNYSIFDDLNFMLRGSFDNTNRLDDTRYYNDTYVRAPNGYYTVGSSNRYQLFGDALLTYDKEFFDDNFGMSISVGGSMKKNRGSGVGGSTAAGLVIPNFFTLGNTTVQGAGNDFGYSYNTNSVYGFGTFSWKDAIFLDVTGRNDWSSTLPAESRSYFYPSIGTSIVLNELLPFPGFISFTKLRGSYAEVGNSANPYMLDRTATFPQGGRNGYLYFGSVLPNEHLVPERTKATEIGLDMGFFDSRFVFNLTMYQTNTVNQLFTLALPVGSGASSFFTNGGNVQNQGVEIVLFAKPIIASSFSWDIDVNWSLNRNTVTEINDERPRLTISSTYIRDFVLEQGEPFGEIYAKGWERDEQGRVIVGADGMPLTTNGKDVRVANFNPDWRAGMTNSFRFHGFNVSILIDHRQGGTLISNTNALLDGKGATERTLEGRDGGLIFGQNLFSEQTAVLEDGTPNNIAITAEKFWLGTGGRNNPIGEAFVRDATNTRVREMVFGYSLPKKILSNTPLSNVKISLVGRNLFYIYRVSPELDTDLLYGTGPSSEGWTSFAPPTTRSMGFNLKIDF